MYRIINGGVYLKAGCFKKLYMGNEFFLEVFVPKCILNMTSIVIQSENSIFSVVTMQQGGKLKNNSSIPGKTRD